MRICFVALNAYPVLHGGTTIKQVGGAETQQVKIARLLQRQGHEVSFITHDHGQPDAEIIQGFRIYKAYKPAAGWPVLRFIHPRWTSLWSAINRAQADLYYTRAAGFIPGMLALMRSRRPFRYVYAGAHDTNFMPGHERLALARDRWLYQLGLRHADVILVQNEVQRDLLKKHYHRDGVLIPNFLDEHPRSLPDTDRTEILWVGRLAEFKRPLLFVELARRLPTLSFKMIGPPNAGEQALYDKVVAASEGVHNLSFLGFQPPSEVEKHFDRCRTLVSTSYTEGFPNTFLQAMRRGIPVVSFVDPSGMIGRNGLGIVVSSETELENAVLASVAPGAFMPGPIQGYFAANFGPGAVDECYRDLVSRLEGPS